MRRTFSMAMGVLFGALVILALPIHAIAAVPTAPGISAVCLNALRQASNIQPSQCIVDSDCVNGWQCHELQCVSPEDAAIFRRAARANRSGQQGAADGSGSNSRGDLTAANTLSAEELCGADRRCRIERLKSDNRARRQQTVFEEERAVQNIVREFHRQEKEATVRTNHPWTIDFLANFLGWGFSGGYSFSNNLRAEIGFTRNDDYMYYYDNTTSLSGRHRATFLVAQAVLIPMESWLTPYLALGFMGGSGTFGNDSFYGGWGSSDMDVKYHILHASGGLDAQFDFGLHLRLGFRYGYVLYNQASLGPGLYEPTTRSGLESWMEETLLSIDFNMGWAF